MDCNLKEVKLTVFKFSDFPFQNTQEQVMSCSFQEFSLFLSLDVLDLSCNQVKVLLHHFHDKR